MVDWRREEHEQGTALLASAASTPSHLVGVILDVGKAVVHHGSCGSGDPADLEAVAARPGVLHVRVLDASITLAGLGVVVRVGV